MTKFRDVKIKETSGAYERAFGNDELGQTFSRVQPTAIRNGNELEDLIVDILREKGRLIPGENLDLYLEEPPEGTHVATQKMVKESKHRIAHHAPDFIAFTVNGDDKKCLIVELKDGYTFDTKKSSGEKATLTECADFLNEELDFEASFALASFSQPDKKKLVHGLKGRFEEGEVMNADELFSSFALSAKDLSELKAARLADAKDNFHDFLADILAIPEVQKEARAILGTE